MGLFGNNSTVTTTFKGKDDLSPVVRGMRNTMEGFKRDARSGFGLAAGISIFAAAGKAIDFAGESLRAYAEEQVSVAKLTTSLKENARAWDGNVEAIENVLRSRMRLGFSDDEQRQSLAETVAAIGDVNDALALQRTAMDLARLKNVSLADASGALTKAYNGSITGLQRMGIKLEKGTKGMDAVIAVQKRAAGQAQAYAETTQGAMQVSSIAFDEFKESVGGALNDALQPFFKLVVDLTNQTPDLDTTVGKLTQSYRDQIEATKQLNEEGQKQGDIFYDLYSFFAPQDRAIHDFTGTLGDYSRILGVSRQELALFTEAGLTAGKTLPDLRKVLDNLVSAQVADRIKDIGYAWQTGMDRIETTTPDAVVAVGSLAKAVKRATSSSIRTLESAKDPWKQAWKDLAEYAKDPFKPRNFSDYIERYARRAARKGKEAADDNRPKVAQAWYRLAAAAKNKAVRQLVLIGVAVDDAIADIALVKAAARTIGSAVNNAVSSVFGGADGGSGGIEAGGKKGGRRGGRRGHRNATGGATSGISVVGEYGPEIIRSGSAKAHVTPSHAGRGDIVLQIDGYTLMRWIDNRMGRQMAFSGLGD